MISNDKKLTLADVNEKTYEKYREEYGRRISDYLCGKGITDTIEWFKPEDFKEKEKMGPIACPKKNHLIIIEYKNIPHHQIIQKMKEVNYVNIIKIIIYIKYYYILYIYYEFLQFSFTTI